MVCGDVFLTEVSGKRVPLSVVYEVLMFKNVSAQGRYANVEGTLT